MAQPVSVADLILHTLLLNMIKVSKRKDATKEEV